MKTRSAVTFVLSVGLAVAVTSDSSAFYRLPDTDQHLCYQAVDPYGVIPCDGTGQDGEYSMNPMEFVDNGDGTVTELMTGLVWARNSAPDTGWFKAAGIYDSYYNPGGESVCGALEIGGASDWRLPSRKELMGIVAYGEDAVVFPGDWSFRPRWSSTTTGESPFYAWLLTLHAEDVDHDHKQFIYPVRCVRGEETPQSFVYSGGATLTDGRTGLVWQVATEAGGQFKPPSLAWGDALAACEELVLGGHSDWRLPNVKELESFADASRVHPAADLSMVPSARYFTGGHFWSSTTYAHRPEQAWLLDFSVGYVYQASKTLHYYTRCVRGGYGLNPPQIGASTETLGQAAVEATDAPAQSFEIWNSGGDRLSYRITASAAWVGVSPGEGDSTGEHDTVVVSYASSALSPGTHSAEIVISDPFASNNPQVLGVTITVLADNDRDGLPDDSDADDDNDGYPDDIDCDPLDPAVNPSSSEGLGVGLTCRDHKDNDCDGGKDLADDACPSLPPLHLLLGVP